jgi:hypothetical protein
MTGQQDFDTALNELAADPVPVGFADQALTTAARRRRRDRILTVAGTAVLVVAVAIPVTLVRHDGSTPTPAGTSSATRVGPPPKPVISSTIALCKPSNPGAPQRPAPGGQAVLSYEVHTNDVSDPWYAWDPQARQYIKAAQPVRPSPDGAWGLVPYSRQIKGKYTSGFSIAPWNDAIHGNNLHRFLDKGAATWAPDNTVVAVDNRTRTTTYVNPATMASRTVPWPADLIQRGEVVIGFGAITNQQVVFWSYNGNEKRHAVYVRVVDQAGLIVRTTAVGAPVPPYSADSLDANATPILEQTIDPIAVSPDGRYVAQQYLILDTAACRETDGPATWDGSYAGWYGGDLVLKTTRGDKHTPINLNAMDANGKVAFGTPLTALPGYGNGVGTIVTFVAAAGPATQGAVTI